MNNNKTTESPFIGLSVVFMYITSQNTMHRSVQRARAYYRTDYAPAKDRKAAEEWCDLLNERLGVTKSQRKGMEVGSMFGFDVYGINPDYYDFCNSAQEVIKEVIEETKNKQN